MISTASGPTTGLYSELSTNADMTRPRAGPRHHLPGADLTRLPPLYHAARSSLTGTLIYNFVPHTVHTNSIEIMSASQATRVSSSGSITPSGLTTRVQNTVSDYVSLIYLFWETLLLVRPNGSHFAIKLTSLAHGR